VKAAVTLDLPLETVEEIALKLHDLPAPQARHMDVVPLRPSFVEMLLTLQVHEVKFVHQAMALEQTQGSIDSYLVNSGIEFARATQQLARVEMLFGGLDHAKYGAPLTSHAQSPRHQFGL